MHTNKKINRKISVAPMMDCTDRHDRFFLRLISKNVMLYSEMVATKSAIHGDREKILGLEMRNNLLHYKWAVQIKNMDFDKLLYLS